ncbi:MAG: hypothetical protein ABFQ95_04980 [Pseudomonadota bacterium]
MKIKYLIITGMLASLPLSAGLQANCKGLNAQEADFRKLLEAHKMGAANSKLIAVDKPKYAKALWFMNYEIPLIKYTLQKGDDEVCSMMQVKFNENVQNLKESSYFLP